MNKELFVGVAEIREGLEDTPISPTFAPDNFISNSSSLYLQKIVRNKAEVDAGGSRYSRVLLLAKWLLSGPEVADNGFITSLASCPLDVAAYFESGSFDRIVDNATLHFDLRPRDTAHFRSDVNNTSLFNYETGSYPLCVEKPPTHRKSPNYAPIIALSVFAAVAAILIVTGSWYCCCREDKDALEAAEAARIYQQDLEQLQSPYDQPVALPAAQEAQAVAPLPVPVTEEVKAELQQQARVKARANRRERSERRRRRKLN